MGQGAVRSQMNIRIAFRVQEQRDVDLILGQGMLKAGWHAHKLNAPGKFLLWSPEHDTPRRARAYLVTDDDVTDAVARYAPARPQLDAISRLALTEGPPAPQPPAEPSPDRHAAAPDDAEPPGDGQEDPDAILRRALSAAPAEGIPVSDLITVTGMSRRWGLLPATPARRRWLRRPDGTRPLAHREMTTRNRECKVQVHTLPRVCTYSGTISSCTCTNPPSAPSPHVITRPPLREPLRASHE